MFEDELNEAQRAAVAHGEGPLLIVAGAGTGKTTTLACRVAALIERGVRPERILLLTFSRRASREMLARAERATGAQKAGQQTGRVWGGTFHAVGNRLLRLHGRALGLAPDFTVLDQADGADVMNLVREELGLAAKDRRFPRKELSIGVEIYVYHKDGSLYDQGVATVRGIADQFLIHRIDDKVHVLQRNLADENGTFVRKFGNVERHVAPLDGKADCRITVCVACPSRGHDAPCGHLLQPKLANQRARQRECEGAGVHQGIGDRDFANVEHVTMTANVNTPDPASTRTRLAADSACPT
jgi:hypothetical protein